jgi:hypothetical protein
LIAALKRCVTRKNCTGAAVVSVNSCLPKNQFAEMASSIRRQIRLQERVRTGSDGAHAVWVMGARVRETGLVLELGWKGRQIAPIFELEEGSELVHFQGFARPSKYFRTVSSTLVTPIAVTRGLSVIAILHMAMIEAVSTRNR